VGFYGAQKKAKEIQKMDRKIEKNIALLVNSDGTSNNISSTTRHMNVATVLSQMVSVQKGKLQENKRRTELDMDFKEHQAEIDELYRRVAFYKEVNLTHKEGGV
jgi:hypothetical protein